MPHTSEDGAVTYVDQFTPVADLFSGLSLPESDSVRPTDPYGITAFADFLADKPTSVSEQRSANSALIERIEQEHRGAIGAFDVADRTQTGVQQARSQAVQSAIDQINAQYEAAVSGAGGVTAAHRRAIAEALELLRDVQGNRAAIAQEYGRYIETTDPHEQAAIEAAGGVVEAATPALSSLSEEREQGIRVDFDEAESIVSDVAELIGAGDRAQAAAKERISGESMALDHAAQEAAEIMALVEMEEAALKTGAEAESAVDEGRIRRRAEETDVAFKQQEKAASNRLARARAAARAAAAAAARRRAAARRQRDAAVAAARQELGGLDPIEAGQFGALTYLGENGGFLPADRQQFVQGRAMEAIENFMPADPDAIEAAYNAEGRVISRQEAELIAGAIDAFRDTRDREQHFVDIGSFETGAREALEAGGSF